MPCNSWFSPYPGRVRRAARACHLTAGFRRGVHSRPGEYPGGVLGQVVSGRAAVVLPFGGEGQDKHDRAVLALLSEQSAGQPWRLGYLDTGADGIVFPDAPKMTLYSGWHYMLVERIHRKPVLGGLINEYSRAA